jgi:hypothetical protein
MKREMWKPLMWGAILGAIVILIVIFATGWVVTSSTAQANAKQMTEKAVLDRLVPICLAQFQKDPNKGEKLKELKNLKTWGEDSQDIYVKKQGWATMPGEKEADGNLANECARRLVQLK